MKPMFNNNEIIYFQVPTKIITRQEVLKSHSSYKDILNMFLVE